MFFAGRILQGKRKGRVYEYCIRISPNSKHAFPPDCITDHVIVTGEFRSIRPVTVLWRFLWSAPWINGWINNREAGDLRCHRDHYDVIVMFFTFTIIVSQYMVTYYNILYLIHSLLHILYEIKSIYAVYFWSIYGYTSRFSQAVIRIINGSVSA